MEKEAKMSKKNVRLYIDGENMKVQFIHSYLEIAREHGEVVSIKVFGCFVNHTLVGWKRRNDICEIIDVAEPGKNAADDKLIEVLSMDYKKDVNDTFVLVSNDKDFISVAKELIDFGVCIININTTDTKGVLNNSFTNSYTILKPKTDPRASYIINAITCIIKQYTNNGELTKFSLLVEEIYRKLGKVHVREVLGYSNSAGIAGAIRNLNHFIFETIGNVIYILPNSLTF